MRRCSDCFIGGVMLHHCPVCGSSVCSVCVGHHAAADHGQASSKPLATLAGQASPNPLGLRTTGDAISPGPWGLGPLAAGQAGQGV
jgi:hypothetical protein